jgi:lipid-A-disaccharide synthase
VGGSHARVLIVAGEASGDHHAARLVEALARLGPIEARGMAGPRLAAAGVTPVVDPDDLAVIGFSGVLSRLPRIARAFGRLLAEARAFRPHAAVLVDTPGFNFRLGPRLHRAGIPVYYYIAPQVWAWHASRARAMAAWVRRLAVIFPFEEPLFRDAGVTTRWVGHPLLEGLEAEVDRPTLLRELGAPPGARVLGLLPGSREQELRAHLPVMAAAAARLAQDRPDLVPVVALAPGLAPGPLPAAVRVVRDRTRAVQAWSTCAAVASGTASLETALFGTPEVIVYRTGALNYAIARRVVKLARIGLPNIVAGAEVAPELLQGACTAGSLAATLARWLDDPAARAAASAGLAVVRERLGGPGASARAAAWLWEMLAAERS